MAVVHIETPGFQYTVYLSAKSATVNKVPKPGNDDAAEEEYVIRRADADALIERARKAGYIR